MQSGIVTGEQLLYVGYQTNNFCCAPERGVVFGRGAQVDLGADPRLHRSLGHLRFQDGQWWLANVGRSVPLHVVDEVTGATSIVPAGAQTALHSSSQLVWTRVGGTRYELHLHQPDVEVPPVPAAGAAPGTATVDAGVFPLNDEQRQLLVALCETRLRDPFSPIILPKNSAVAHRLGWSTAKFNRKLDYLCERAARLGVTGVQSDQGRAPDRRRHLAEWALASNAVGPSDLDLLP